MQSVRRALLDGAMVVVPLGAVVLLVLGIIRKLEDAAAPLAEYYIHPTIAAVALLVFLCLLVGLLVRSTPGCRARQGLESMLFEKVPGYRLAKAFAGEGLLAAHEGRTMRPALARIEEGECPALVMDEFVDGRLLVFVPGSPATMSGDIYIFTPDRVTYLEVPLLSFLKAISSWGLGLREIVERAAPLGKALPSAR